MLRLQLAPIPEHQLRVVPRPLNVGLRLEAGHFEAMAPFAQLLRGGSLEPMPLAMDAASGVSPGRRARIAHEAGTALLGNAANAGVPQAAWVPGVVELGEDFRGALKARVPVLMISGTLDGRTGPDNAGRGAPAGAQAEHDCSQAALSGLK